MSTHIGYSTHILGKSQGIGKGARLGQKDFSQCYNKEVEGIMKHNLDDDDDDDLDSKEQNW